MSKGDVHVSPVNDLREHDLSSRSCWCQPEIIPVLSKKGRVLVIHNAADGRDLVERYGVQ